MVWYFSEALRFEAKGRRHYVGIRARDSGKVDVFGSYYPGDWRSFRLVNLVNAKNRFPRKTQNMIVAMSLLCLSLYQTSFSATKIAEWGAMSRNVYHYDKKAYRA